MEVKECMTKNVYYCNPDTNVADAAKLMGQNHVGCIPVCDDQKKIVGLLTDRDIVLRTICQDKDVKTTPVSEVMSTKVCCCNPETKVKEIISMMSDSQIRRIPVCDDENKIVGILSLGDISRCNDQIGEENIADTLENICECKQNAKNAE